MLRFKQIQHDSLLQALVGPQQAKSIRGRILRINDFRDSLLLAPTAKSGKTRHFALEHPLDLILICKKWVSGFFRWAEVMSEYSVIFAK